MRAFRSAEEAKEYLISQLTLAAKREGVRLSEMERQMMYFSETAWAPPGMWAVNETFAREYDTPSYEAKIAGLAGTARAHASATGSLDVWNDAVRVLGQEDHYLLVLLGARAGSSDSALRDRLKLVGTAFLIVLLIVVGILLFSSTR